MLDKAKDTLGLSKTISTFMNVEQWRIANHVFTDK